MKIFFSISVLALSLSLYAKRVCIFDFEELPNFSSQSSTSIGSEVSISTNFSTIGKSSLRLSSEKWRCKNCKCTFAELALPKDLSRFDAIRFDALLCHSKGATGTIGFIGGKKHIIEPFFFSRPGVRSFTFPLPKEKEHLTHIRFTSSRPAGEIDIYIDNVQLLDKDENLKNIIDEQTLKYERKIDNLSAQHDHLLSYTSFLASCIESGTLTNSILLGCASSMEKIRPRAKFNVKPAKKLSLSLAGNEYESIQLIVAPFTNDLNDVKVELAGDLIQTNGWRIEKKHVKISPVGFVYTQTPESRWELNTKPLSGWWPDPILDYPFTLHIKDHDIQSFWIKVHADENQKPGKYTGEVKVTVSGEEKARIPLEVKVRAYTLPKKPPLKTLTSSVRHNLSADFLEDFLIFSNQLYCKKPNFADIDAAIKRNTLGIINLGWVEVERDMTKNFDLNKWKETYMPRLEKSYQELSKRGVQSNAVVYACDELPQEASCRLRDIVKIIKERFPKVKIITTSFDSDAGMKGSILSEIDAMCPTTKRYVEELDKIKEARENGKEIWWYICKDPEPPFANAYIECPAIDLRALMGAMTTKWEPDGFLYWSLTQWRKNKPLSNGPFISSWQTKSFNDYNGDGSWLYPGPDGKPIASIRLENFRDGLEDYAAALLLKKLGGDPTPSESLVKTPKDFSQNPEDYLAWREKISDEIEKRISTEAACGE